MSENSALNFKDYDKLERKCFCEKLENFLLIEHDFVEGSLVVSLNAPFGSGKTTFLSMWKDDFEGRKKMDEKLPTAIILNAWESDYCGDPLLSIVASLIHVAETDEPKEAASRLKLLRDAAEDIAWFSIGSTNSTFSKWAGIDPLAGVKLAKEKKESKKPKVLDFVTLYEKRTQSLQKLKAALRENFGGEHPKVFIFVDELDRCRPDYAISYLETIKHVFDIHGLVFVLAVDYGQLESSAKALFGEGLVFSEYFRKFVQRSFNLPMPSEAGLESLARHYAQNYIEKQNKRMSMIKMPDAVDRITELSLALKMTPRQIQEVFRIVGHTSIGNVDTRGGLYWCIGSALILMASLKVSSQPYYVSLGDESETPENFAAFLLSLFKPKEARWWFSVYATSSQRQINDLPGVFQKTGLSGKDEPIDLNPFTQGWGSYSYAGLPKIYQEIESASTFAQK